MEQTNAPAQTRRYKIRDTFALPEVHRLLAPNLALIPLQLFACYTAAIKGTNATPPA